VGAGPVVVVGGGIAGLTAALELAEAGAAVTVVEAADRFGGKIATNRVDGLVVEAGADSFLSTKPAGLALAERLGISDRLVNSRAEDRRTFVWSRGRLRELPEGLVLGSPTRAWSLLRSGLLSPAGAARLVGDLVVPRRRGADGDGGRAGQAAAEETVAEFFTRRLGPEAYARVVEPLLAGIHAGDATRLSLPATFPRFVDMERHHGGLVRAGLASQLPNLPKPLRRMGSAAGGGRSETGGSLPEYGGKGTPDRGAGPIGPVPKGRTPFVSFRTGMAELVEALEARLQSLGVELRVGQAVASIRAVDHAYEVVLDGGAALPAAAVVVATPAPAAAVLIRPLCPVAATALAEIEHASTATVSLAYRADDVGTPPAGYGFVVPRGEGRHLLAGTWGSGKWPGRAPAGQVLVRGYVGGIGREAVLEVDDDGLVHLVRAELGALAGIRGTPVHTEVHRFPAGMPQYTVGHLARVARIRSALAACPGLAVTGAPYNGVGIPDCIADAQTTARAVLSTLMPT
jgi:oxygen-dependent protoporphyrinogen oxidase